MTEVMMPVGQRARSGASSALNEGVREFYGVPSSLFHSVQGQNKSVRSVAVAWREGEGERESEGKREGAIDTILNLLLPSLLPSLPPSAQPSPLLGFLFKK